ncbi:sn-glycerol 3-phosphate transport system ATP-binding protein [Desulfurobacterium atlanticum]|uniref:sn-glycerol 3-phosphate transport system ATP-binding protein n=2 Tax=Desulfurobacterium atlanticum TaxID=240169 RepID=A0A238Y728_9BACT|nr:sn-glycerol 3-phosphate transport system ATP-binding protein [Desulfurobacterium atlanticum]
MVFQSYALFPHMNVRENIVFGLKVRKVKKEEIEKRLYTVTKMLKIDKLLDRKPSQLSGGQRQRVALARAIISERPVCLMDEPLSNLDAKLRSAMRKELKSLQQKLNLTVIYVTHDQIEAMSMADEIILINNGKIEQHAEPTTIYENPKTTYVAEFIGTPPMNIFDVKTIESFPFKIPENAVKVGVRPEDISFKEDEIKIGEGEVVFSEYHGSEIIYSVNVKGDLINAKLTEKEFLSGKKVSLYCKKSKLHFFDGKGKKL